MTQMLNNCVSHHSGENSVDAGACHTMGRTDLIRGKAIITSTDKDMRPVTAMLVTGRSHNKLKFASFH